MRILRTLIETTVLVHLRPSKAALSFLFILCLGMLAHAQSGALAGGRGDGRPTNYPPLINNLVPLEMVGFDEPSPFFVDYKAAPGGDGLSWATAFNAIQPAVDAAQAAGGGGVWVAEGTYLGTEDQVVSIPPGVNVYGGFTGVESSLSERNPATHQTIIDGQTVRRGVFNNGLLDGFVVQNSYSYYGGGIQNNGTVTGCTVTANSASDGYGGGIQNNGTVTSCTVTANSASSSDSDSYGGGIYNSNNGTVTGCTVTANFSSAGSGGIINYGTVTSCTLTGNSASCGGGGMDNFGTVTGCTLTGNSAYYNGGGMDNFGTVIGCTLMGNSAYSNGGGIYNEGTVTDCLVTANSASSSDSFGGGINNYGTVTGCTVTGNSASVGGGIENANNGTVTGCTVTGNSASSAGGGIYNNCGMVTGCTVTDNSASSTGGGIYNNYGTVTGCTVTANSASYCGGIENYGQVTNCIVWRNRAMDVSGDLSSVSYSCFIEATGADHNLRANPRFVSTAGTDPLAWDLRLLPDSPCIDAGTTDDQTLPATDLAGNPRPGGDGLVDMGAYESPDAYTPGLPTPLVLYVSPQGDGTTGQDWARAFNTITSAIQAAMDGGDLYEIRVAAGTYREGREIVLDSRIERLSGGWSANGAQPDERDAAVFKTIIDGEQQHRCMTNHALLDGLWIQNGSADWGGGIYNDGTVTGCTVTANYAVYEGGGISNNDGTVTSCTVTDNSVGGGGMEAYGGGILNSNSGTVTGCTVTANFSSVGGGGIETYGGTVTGCTVTNNSSSVSGGGIEALGGTVTNCLVTGNSADGDGGGVYNDNGTATGCTVTGNSANYGGGIYDYNGTVTGCTVTANSASSNGAGIYNASDGMVTGCTVTGNSASSYGGGIYNDATVTTCTVTGNSASYGGGGIYNYITVTGCTVAGNSASYGGGIYNSGTVTGCTVAGNSAAYGGSGIYSYGTVTGCMVTGNSASGSESYGGGMYNSGTVTGCTVTGNSASEGGGIDNEGTVTNCIVWRNSAMDVSGDLSSVSYSCFIEATGSNHNLRANPRFVSMAGNDPLAWDLRLQPGSPCIDAGATDSQNIPATDLAGNPRPGGDGLVDMGAYESPDAYTPGPPAPPVVLYVSPQGDGTTGLDWARAFNTITSATQAAMAGGDLYEIRVAAGTYREGREIVLNSQIGSLSGGWSANGAQPDERNAAVFKTIIDGEQQHRCLTNYTLLDGLWIQNGSAEDGGGIYNYGTVTGCTVTANSASYEGGGIYNSNNGTVTGCTVTGNSASSSDSSSYGGGIYNSDNGTVTGCMVAGNSARGSESSYGGGIYNYGTVTGCTVAGNSAIGSDTYGGGIRNNGTVTGCIVWRNSATDILGSLEDVSYSCFGEATGANHNLQAVPRFVSTAGNDPLAWDLRLLPNSPCIDAGTTAGLTLPTTDLAGNPRPGGDGLVDMGAYESPDAYTPGPPAPPVVLYVSPQGDGTTGLDWARAFNTITSATQAVQAGDDLYEIRVAAGTYREGREIVLAGRIGRLSGGWSANGAQPDERNAAVFKTIIDGERQHRCLTNYSLLDGLWIQNGFAEGCGGIDNYGTVTGCIVTGNSASDSDSYGGGIHNDGTVMGCTVTGNSASYGGGICNHGTVAGCTVTGNSATEAGSGIRNSGTVTGCIVWRNSMTDIADDLSDVTYSCFGEAAGSNHNLRANPRFVSTAGNDPLAWDLRLQPGSPCIDAGTTAGLTLPTTDLAGNPRPGGDGLVDMGAYESPDAYTPGPPTPPLVLYVSPQGDGTTGQDWARAFNTITSATQVAMAGDDFYEIRVAAGTYREGREIVLAGRIGSLSGGWSANGAQPDERNAAVFKTIIDGEQQHRCLTNYTLLDGLWIQNGSAEDGGGMENYGTVTGCMVTGNSASYDGGGIYNHGTVTGSTVTDGSASYGGGIYNSDNATVTGCTVTGNSASSSNSYGGGIYNYGTVTGSMVTGNASSSYGGGIYNGGTVTGCTVTSNSASEGGGGMYNYGTVTNCIVWRNSATDIRGSLSEVSYSCFNEATEANHNLQADPLFVSTSGSDPLAWDLRLLPDSPCIDAGTTAGQTLPATDLAGNPRPGDDGLVDMGAYEHLDPVGTVVIQPVPNTASWSLTNSSGDLVANGLGNATLTDVAVGEVTLTWDTLPNFNPPTPNPDTRTLVSNQTLTFAGTYTRKHGTVVVDATPNSASWSFTDGDGTVHNGSGDATVNNVPTGSINLTWGPLAGYIAPTPNPANQGLTQEDTVTFTGAYTRQKGAVVVDVTPNTASWSFTDGDGTIHNGTGDATVNNVPTGSINLTWGALAGYTTPNLAIQTLGKDQATSFVGTYIRQKGTVAVTVTPATAPWSFTDGDGVIHNGTGEATVNNVPTGMITLTWGALAGYTTPNLAIQTLGKDQSTLFAGTYIRQKGTVAVTVTPASAPWSFTDGEGVVHNGTGEATVNNVPTGSIALSWGVLASYDAPTPNPAAIMALAQGATVTFTGNYQRQRGTVVVNVTPATAPWSFTDGDGGVHHGVGSKSEAGVPTGTINLTWGALAGSDAPAVNPVSKTLGKDGPVCFQEVLLPSATGPQRDQSRIIRYLLGLDTNPAGLDVNGDGKVNIADVASSKVNAIAPGVPSAPSPVNGATLVSLTPRLSWAPAPYAKRYDLYLWKATDTTPTTPVASGLLTPAVNAPATLSYATSYKWRVAAHNVSAQTAGPVWKFTTKPQWVRVVSPNGANTWTRRTNVQVRYMVDTRKAGITYRIELWRGNTKAATLKAASSNTTGDKTETIALAATLAPASNYKVRVTSSYLETHNGGTDAWDASDQTFTVK